MLPPSDPPHLLVVDDEHFILSALQLYFETNGFRVSTAPDGREALQKFRNRDEPIDIIILDLVMPGTHGLDLLKSFKQIDPGVQVIIATGCGSMGSAIEALRLGAFDFITKPILDFDKDLMKSVNNALEVRRKQAQRAEESESESDPDADADEAGADESVDHWLGIYQELNDFADAYVGKPPAPKVLQAIWRILSDGFGADAAVLLAQQSDASWASLHSWGLPVTGEFSDELKEEIASILSSGTTGSFTIGTNRQVRTVEKGAPATGAPSDGESPALRKILHLPLLGHGNSQKVLLLFYRHEDRLSAETGPVALLTTIVSPILNQYAPQRQEDLPELRFASTRATLEET